MTVQELKKIIDRLVNSGRGEYEVQVYPYTDGLDETQVDVSDDAKEVDLG